MSRAGFFSKQLQAEGKVVMTTNGCFDLLHLGHLSSFELSRSLGTVLWVGVNSDDSFRLNKHRDPVFPSDVRIRMLAALEIVDYVTVFEESDPSGFIRTVNPVFHMKGSDYTQETLKETPAILDLGATILFSKSLPGFLTSEIIRRIKSINGEDYA